jgi:hypothetical protein
MKKLIFSFILLCITAFFGSAAVYVSAQSSAIDKLFDKYSKREGFSSVNITKDMFELFSEGKKDMVNAEVDKAITGLRSIRILTVQDPELNKNINFFDEIGKQIPMEEYTPLMTVSEKNQEMRMMVKKREGKITEFLMISGGKDNVLISITGDIDLGSISKISGGMPGLENLGKVDQK